MTAIAIESPDALHSAATWLSGRRFLPSTALGSGSASNSPVFGATRSDDWLIHVKRSLEELIALPAGWDGHGGRPVDLDIAAFTLQLLAETMANGAPPPQLIPLSYGGLQLEWHEVGIDLEMEVEAPNHTYLDYADQRTGEVIEREVSTDFADLSRILRLLAARRSIER